MLTPKVKNVNMACADARISSFAFIFTYIWEVTKKKAKPNPWRVRDEIITGRLGTINRKYLMGQARIPITMVTLIPNFLIDK